MILTKKFGKNIVDHEEMTNAYLRALEKQDGKVMNSMEILFKEYGSIIDKKIVGIRPLIEQELKELYWQETVGNIAFAIILEDGQVLVPSSDPEGNGPGFIILAELN